MRYALMICLLLSTTALALQPGDSVPELAVPATSGDDICLTDFKGSWVVLYFYPRAFTPGCTAQTCSLRDEFGELTERGAIILGASLDSLERQQSFKEEHGLPFHLLSDSDRELSRSFDVLMTGGLAAQRRTFIINPEGVVAHRFDRPSTRDHAEEVIEKLDELMGREEG